MNVSRLRKFVFAKKRCAEIVCASEISSYRTAHFEKSGTPENPHKSKQQFKKSEMSSASTATTSAGGGGGGGGASGSGSEGGQKRKRRTIPDNEYVFKVLLGGELVEVSLREYSRLLTRATKIRVSRTILALEGDKSSSGLGGRGCNCLADYVAMLDSDSESVPGGEDEDEDKDEEEDEDEDGPQPKTSK
jgi:hypothetical protein